MALEQVLAWQTSYGGLLSQLAIHSTLQEILDQRPIMGLIRFQPMQMPISG
jgi:hypothetical protein